MISLRFARTAALISCCGCHAALPSDGSPPFVSLLRVMLRKRRKAPKSGLHPFETWRALGTAAPKFHALALFLPQRTSKGWVGNNGCTLPQPMLIAKHHSDQRRTPQPAGLFAFGPHSIRQRQDRRQLRPIQFEEDSGLTERTRDEGQQVHRRPDHRHSATARGRG